MCDVNRVTQTKATLFMDMDKSPIIRYYYLRNRVTRIFFIGALEVLV